MQGGQKTCSGADTIMVALITFLGLRQFLKKYIKVMESSHSLEKIKIIILPLWANHYFNFRVFPFSFYSYELLTNF